ncbi:MAG: EVE domain-containing protein [Cyanobacteria bacterium P01_A01_bin.3]
MTQYWLMKSEPSEYSIDDLQREGTTHWDGVRNYQARNFMRDVMQVGDHVLFYHSNTKPPGVAGLATVCRTGYPDFTAWDTADKHYDPKSDPESPTWFMVDIEFAEKFFHHVSLAELKAQPELSGMKVVQRGVRLSVQPVEADHFELVCAMGRSPE